MIELFVDGYFKIDKITYAHDETGSNTHTELESKEKYQSVLKGLQSGDLLFSIKDQTIWDFDGMVGPLYYVELTATDSVEYKFKEK